MEKALKIINELEQAGVIDRYAIGGAMAAVFYIEPVLTYDLDVFVLLPKQNSVLVSLSPIYKALKDRGYEAEGEFVRIDGMPVQFLTVYNELLEEALQEAGERVYHEVPTRVLKPEHLVAISLQTGRGKDRERVKQFHAKGSLDETLLKDILQRHYLTERWNAWK